MELKHYDNNTKFNEDASRQDDNLENNGVIPANTRLQIAISVDDDHKKKNFVEVFISTNNNTIIKAVIVFAEGIFKGETHVVHPPPNKLSSELTVNLCPPKDYAVDIHIKALVGYPSSIQYHVFEITRQLPRFAMYSQIENDAKYPESCVELKINERLQRICMWVNQNFLLPNDMEYEAGPDIRLTLRCLRDDTNLFILFEASGRVVFHTSNTLLASDLVQSLATFLNLDSLEVNIIFLFDSICYIFFIKF